MRRRATPGVGGHLLALLVAGVLVDTGFIGWQVLAQLPSLGWSDVADVVVAWIYGGVYVGVLGAPTALLGLPVQHLLTRRIEAQRVHVAVAGLLGAVAGAAWAVLLSGVVGLTHPWWLLPLAGFACALGRAAVIPWLPWEPVDDDSRRAVPAC